MSQPVTCFPSQAQLDGLFEEFSRLGSRRDFYKMHKMLPSATGESRHLSGTSMTLAEVFEDFQKRWTSLAQTMRNVTDQIACSMYDRKLSADKIVIMTFMHKANWITEVSELAENFLDFFPDDIQWRNIVAGFQPSFGAWPLQNCAEVKHVFLSAWAYVKTLLPWLKEQDSSIFFKPAEETEDKKHVDTEADVFDAFEHVLTSEAPPSKSSVILAVEHEKKEKSCEAGVPVPFLSYLPVDASQSPCVKLWTEFEQGKFEPWWSALMSVQLTLRCALCFQNNPQHPPVARSELSDLQLLEAKCTDSDAGPCSLINFPPSCLKLLCTGRSVRCHVKFQRYSVTPTAGEHLDLWCDLRVEVFYWLFIQENHALTQELLESLQRLEN